MNYELVVPFDRQTDDFARGVEIGMLYQRLLLESLPLSATIHSDNIEMAIRLADTRGIRVQADDSEGDWLSLTYS